MHKGSEKQQDTDKKYQKRFRQDSEKKSICKKCTYYIVHIYVPLDYKQY